MLSTGQSNALLVPISCVGMEGAKGGFAAAQTEAAGPFLPFVVLMARPIYCHAILQKGSSLKKMEILKELCARAGKAFRRALTGTDDRCCVSVCQMGQIQGDFNFKRLSSYFIMILACQRKRKKIYKRKPDVFIPAQ